MTVFYDGEFVDGDSLSFSVTAPSIRYGLGFFETILYSGGVVYHLQDHISRISDSSSKFGLSGDKPAYDNIISQLINLNSLTEKSARINIYHMADSASTYKVMIAAWAYEPPTKDIFKLCVYPEIHDSYMNRYKSMNYAHFIMAKKYATEKGFDDSVLLDMKGNFLETSSASLFFFDGEKYVVPAGDNKLPSISLKNFLNGKDYVFADVNMGNVREMQNIYIINSLMGEKIAEIF